MLPDALVTLVVVAQAGLFAVAAAAAMRRVFPAAAAMPALSRAALGLVLVLALVHVLAMVGVPALLVATPVFLAFEAYGAYLLVRERASVGGVMRENLAYPLVGLVSAVFWVFVMRDLASLPTWHDGVAHQNFLLRILDSDTPLLFRTPRALTAEFGLDYLHYYPSGTHALVAAFDAWLIDLGLLSASAVLKGWMLGAACAVAPAAMWVARTLVPDATRWLAGAVGVLALTFFYYPVWAADSGGFSRLLAQLLLLPVIAALLRPGELWKSQPLRIAVMALAPIAVFQIHPSIFGMFGLSLAFAFLVNGLGDGYGVKRVGLDVVAAGIGLGLLGWLISSSAASDLITTYVDKPTQLEYSPSALLERWRHYVAAMASEHPATERPWPLSARSVFLAAGFALLLTPFGRRVPRAVRFYPLWMLIASFGILACGFSSSPLILKVGHIFYNDPGRLGETMYAVFVLGWTMGLLFLFQQLARRPAWVKPAAVVLGVLLVADGRTYWRFNQRHLTHYFAHYHSPTRSESEELAEFVRDTVEPDALLVYPQFAADSLWPRTGRTGIFMFLDCPHWRPSPNCQAREAYQPIFRPLPGRRSPVRAFHAFLLQR